MVHPVEFFSQNEKIELYKTLLMPRVIEEKMLNLLRQNKLSKWFSGIGQEAVSVGVAYAADRKDPLFTMHRNLGVFTTRQVPLYPLFCQLLGKKDGFTKGRERSFHFGIPQHEIYGMISHLAATMPIADGLALAHKLKQTGQVVFSFTGDGSTSEGDFHEALNLAAVWKLPIVFVIENNGYGLSTPSSQQFACKTLSERASGYGIIGINEDGNDLIKVIKAANKARSLAREGTPVILEYMTFRMRGHEEASGTAYIPKKILDAWAKKDPVDRFKSQLIKEKVLTEKSAERIREEVRISFQSDLENALLSEDPFFDEQVELEDAGFYFPESTSSQGPDKKTNDPAVKSSTSDSKNSSDIVEKRYVDAIRDALMQEMDSSDDLILMGQDIAEYGGVFKVTEGFLEKFGQDRIRNTPIIESGAIGAAIGLTLQNYRAMVEMQFADFISCGFNQIVNNLSKGRYRWMPPMNVTIRAPHGAGVGAGPFHSQSPEGWFMQHPGLRILVPSTVKDAQDMLYTALKDPNPVLFFEHKKLYRELKEMVPVHAEFTTLNTSSVRLEGSDATIITYGYGVHWAIKHANEWSQKGISLEVLDLRSLAPIDWDGVEISLKKTGRVLLLQEPSQTMGPLSELSAGISERFFSYLDAPVMRCSSLDMPIPFSKKLETDYLANARLDSTIEKLLSF